MNRTLITTVIASVMLSSCVVPPSRTYDGKSNIMQLDSSALNVDLIKPVSTAVSSTRTWQNTGVFIEGGDVINVTAHGTWSPATQMNLWSGPEGNILWSVEVPGIAGSALMGKIGHDGQPFGIGTTRTVKAQDYGMLYLAMNDSFSYLFDNKGEITAEIYLDGNSTSVERRELKIISYTYDDATGNGSLSAETGTDHFRTRQRMIDKIGEIASTKNVALKAGKESLQGGNYELRDESTKDGVLTIKFKALW